MTSAGFLLAATLALPLVMVLLCLWPSVRARILNWLPLAPVPGLVAAVLAQGGSLVIAPAPLRLTLALDDPGAMLLGGAALLWGAAGLYAAVYLRGNPGAPRFAIWWLLTLAGSLGCFIVADMTSFYLVFSLASLSAYGLVAFEDTPRAQRASRVYMALALLGEAFILLGFVMLVTATPGGNPLIREVVAALPGSPLMTPALVLLILGFGLKMGLVPMHLWMPLAHPVAPMPASAALSGIIVKAGVIGLIRFLPLEVALPDWGTALIILGLFTAFYAALVGVTQQHPKTVLAYSTVSQMGVVAAVLGAGLVTGAPGTATLAAFYALHHMLVKGALFLGVGLVGATGKRRLGWILVPMAVLALSLAGLPFTSGALAKFATKPLFGYGIAGTLATLSATGSALLMLHFLRRLRSMAPRDSGATPAAGLVLAWGVVAVAAFALPMVLFPQVTGYGLTDTASPKALWAASWPIALGALLALLLVWADAWVPRIPEGDLVVLLERLGPMVGRLGATVEQTDGVLRRWPVASLVLVTLALAFSAALSLAP